MQQPGEHAGSRSAVRLAKEEFGRVPPAEHGQVALDKLFDGASVFVDTPIISVLPGSDRCGIAGADWVYEYQIGIIEQTVRIIVQRVRGGWREVRHVGPDSPRPK